MPQLDLLRKTTTIWHSLPIRYRGAIIIALPFSCLIFTLAASVWSKESSIAIYQEIDHTKTVILDSNKLLKILLDAETATRGYVISQNKNFLEPHNRANEELSEILNRLEKNLSNDAQITRFRTIEKLAKQRISILEQRIAEIDRVKQKNIPPSADILLYQGKNVMDIIRNEINDFQEQELRQLDMYRQDLDDIGDKNNIRLWITLAISIASYIGAIYLFSKLDWQIAGQKLQLQGKKSLIKGIMENVVDGIITLDKKDNIDSFNQAAVTMFGYQSEEVIGKKINLLIPEINQTEKAQFTHTISATHQNLSMYMQGNRQVGANFPLEISISNLENGQGKMVIVRDITEQMQIREKLEANVQELSRLSLLLANSNQALTERNQELDNFAYIASHDLKAPLRGIINLSQWLEEDIKDDLAPENQQQLELLRKRVYRMEALIDGLLEYSRVGRIEIDREKVDVNQLLAEIIDSLNPPATFNIQISGEMPVFTTKKLLLSQVFANLISNAIKHHPRNNGNISISVEDSGDYYQFAVADDGCGIDIQYQERIFTIFQTLESRDKKENTGVGLSIVKKIIESEGGKITLDSELGKGATFHFTWFKS
ncbi:MAG: ATP-binding protein [Rivularia sp. (in: cyanobacteria)]